MAHPLLEPAGTELLTTSRVVPTTASNRSTVLLRTTDQCLENGWYTVRTALHDLQS